MNALYVVVDLADMETMQNDALSLEYKRNYGTASGNLEVSDLINNPAASGKCSVFGLGLEKEPFDFSRIQFGSVRYDSANATLIAQDWVVSCLALPEKMNSYSVNKFSILRPRNMLGRCLSTFNIL